MVTPAATPYTSFPPTRESASPHPRHPPCCLQGQPQAFPLPLLGYTRRRPPTVITAYTGIRVPRARAIRPAPAWLHPPPYPHVLPTQAGLRTPTNGTTLLRGNPCGCPNLPAVIPAQVRIHVPHIPTNRTAVCRGNPCGCPHLPTVILTHAGIRVPRARALTIRPAVCKGNHKGCPYPALATPAVTPYTSFRRRSGLTSPPTAQPSVGATLVVARTSQPLFWLMRESTFSASSPSALPSVGATLWLPLFLSGYTRRHPLHIIPVQAGTHTPTNGTTPRRDNPYGCPHFPTVIPAQARIYVPHTLAIRPAACKSNHKGCPYPSSATLAAPQPSFPRRRESTFPAPSPSAPPSVALSAVIPAQAGIHALSALVIHPAVCKGNHKGCPYPSSTTPSATPQPSFPRRRESTSPAPSPSVPPSARATTRVAPTPPWLHPPPPPTRHSGAGRDPYLHQRHSRL